MAEPEDSDIPEPDPLDPFDDLDEEQIPESVRRRLEAFVPELVRKTFAAGMGAVFTTEEGIRRMTKDLTLPKEVAGYLVSTASTTKDEVLRVLAREIREFLQTVNLSEEIARMLTTLSFEVKTEIRFIPNDEKYTGVEPDVKAKVRVKKAGEKPTDKPGGADEPERPRRRRRFTRRGRDDDES